MKFPQVIIFVSLLSLMTKAIANQNQFGNYPQYNQQPGDQQQEQQQEQQQKYQQQQIPPQQQQVYGQYPGRYSPNPQDYRQGVVPYGRGGQPQQEGVLSKMKNGLISAGTVLASTFDALTTPATDYRDSGPYSSPQERTRAPGGGQYGYPPQSLPPQQRSGNPYPPTDTDQYGRYTAAPTVQQPEEGASSVLSNVFGKLRGMWNNDRQAESSYLQQAKGYGSGVGVPPPPGYRGPYSYVVPPPQQSTGFPPSNAQRSYPPVGPLNPPDQQQGVDPSVNTAPGVGLDLQQQTRFLPQSADYPPLSQQQQPQQTVQQPLSSDFATQQQQQQFYPSQVPLSPTQVTAPPPPAVPVPPQDPLAGISPEPQVFIHEDSIVMIMKPKEFFRKKLDMIRSGPQSIQLFSDFERVLTKAKLADGGLAFSSAELLEASGVLSPAATSQLKTMAAEFESADMDYAAFEDLTVRSQAVVAKEGALHIGTVGPTTSALTSKLGLRDGWAAALSAVSTRGVPAYIFSSGYGDVVAQVLLQGGLNGANSAAGGLAGQQLGASPHLQQQLPQNIRIVSNMFRTAPDGTVRAFSQPVVHERNKNATTAARHMGMPLVDRPYAVVLGSHEDDVHMTDGLVLTDQLSVGFLEVAEDFAQRLPVYLSTFDAVIIGDSSLHFAKNLLEELMHLPKTDSTGKPVLGAGAGGTMRSNAEGIVGAAGARITNLRKGLGMFLNRDSQQQSDKQQQGIDYSTSTYGLNY